jgi:hypothetical protein
LRVCYRANGVFVELVLQRRVQRIELTGPVAAGLV